VAYSGEDLCNSECEIRGRESKKDVAFDCYCASFQNKRNRSTSHVNGIVVYLTNAENDIKCRIPTSMMYGFCPWDFLLQYSCLIPIRPPADVEAVHFPVSALQHLRSLVPPYIV